MKIGYARVSTQEQNLDLQIQALQKTECEKIFQEKISGAKDVLPELEKAIDYLREGDTLVVWKIDRLGRSILGLVKLMNSLQEKKVHFVSLKDNIDTTTPTGRFMYNLMAIFAEMERENIRERTKAGLKAAKEQGRVGGRPKGLGKEAKQKANLGKQLYESGEQIDDIARVLGISKPTLYKYFRAIDFSFTRKPRKKH